MIPEIALMPSFHTASVESSHLKKGRLWTFPKIPASPGFFTRTVFQN